MFAFYTFLSSLYNYLLKSILFTILLEEVRKFLGEELKISGEVQSHSRGRAHLPPKMRPWSMILFCVYMMYFDIKGIGVISIKQNKVFLVNGLTKISTLEINYNMNLH